MPADPTRPPVPLDRIEQRIEMKGRFAATFKTTPESIPIDLYDLKALTAALRRQDAALERIAWALDGDDPVVIACDAMAEVRAAVSFSPTGGEQ